MVYGMILPEHTKWEPTEQRVGIQDFAKKIGLKIDKIPIMKIEKRKVI